ncbi:Cytochrome c oxidase subunit 4 isoform 2, mitochondrial [Trichoplax sp. H2]|nr:Cytochrome c oxidase subunit 4 isoform 2, mitochondrial [Trichoplax sp. H2]|eukprot:RDD47593.1 Cytochrome c oxidase subunit 4 isoform 2, mitochondrial [Trichoplax sp. H2]
MLSRFVVRSTVTRHLARKFQSSSHVANAEAPAINQQLRALEEKAKGPWKELSAQEKIAIYRQSFKTTVAEHRKPGPSKWQPVFLGTSVLILVATGIFMFMKAKISPPTPRTVNKEWKEAQRQRLLSQQANPIEGMSSKK